MPYPLSMSYFGGMKSYHGANVTTTAAHWIADRVAAARARYERVIVAVPGGRSIVGPLSELATLEADWTGVEFFFVDERFLPAGDPRRNDTTVSPLLMQLPGMTGARIHTIAHSANGPEAAASAYEEGLVKLGGRFHVVVLGAGEDCHVASLFPGSPLLGDERTGFAAVRDAPKPPQVRITATSGLLQSAEAAALLFLGEAKRPAYERFAAEATAPSDCPARAVATVSDLAVFVAP